MKTISESTLTVKKWVKSTALGWFLGIIMILVLATIFDFIGLDGYQFFIGIGMGGSIGLMQWSVLKKIIVLNTNWIWTSLLGLGIPFLISDVVSVYFEKPLGAYYLPVSIGLGAVLISLLQFKILKDHSAKAHRWLPACFTGWVLAALTVLSIDYIKLVISGNWVLFFINLTMILAGGAVLGFVTGKAIVTILDQSELHKVPAKAKADLLMKKDDVL